MEDKAQDDYDYTEEEPLNIKENDPVAIWELDLKKEIENMKNILLGRKEVENGFVQIGEPVINEKGVNTIMLHIYSLASKVTSLTKLNEKEIKIDCREFRRSIRNLLVYYGNEWEVKPMSKSLITQTLDTFMNSLLNKSKEALMLKIRRQQIMTREIVNKEKEKKEFPI